ncbi:hypothetical protein Tco_1390568, partial [Tanacetum coccineum]
ATSSSSKVSCRRASLQEIKGSPVGSVSSSPLKALNLDKLSPAAGRTISRKAHAKSSIGPEVPRKLLAREDNMQSRDINASQSQKLGGTCNDAYFDSALKFLHAASLPEAYYNDFSKLKGMVDPLSV